MDTRENRRSFGGDPTLTFSRAPSWLAQIAPWLLDLQGEDAAHAWRKTFDGRISRLNAAIPFSVVHDWQANVVGALAIAASENKAHVRLAAMHTAAREGSVFDQDEWYQALKAAFKAVYGDLALGDEFAAYICFAASVYADAYSDDDEEGYCNANAFAFAAARTYAYCDLHPRSGRNDSERAGANRRLADGFLECLERVQ
jgi:hypothetical protein